MNKPLSQSIYQHTAVIAWVVLVALTILSWYLSLDLKATIDNAHKYTTTGIFLLAFFKVRLVIIHFMELGHAPLALRGLFEAWVLVVCSLLIGMYWLLPLNT